jgi:hypothetical protein
VIMRKLFELKEKNHSEVANLGNQLITKNPRITRR